jgi:hypothetical protein
MWGTSWSPSTSPGCLRRGRPHGGVVARPPSLHVQGSVLAWPVEVFTAHEATAALLPLPKAFYEVPLSSLPDDPPTPGLRISGRPSYGRPLSQAKKQSDRMYRSGFARRL